MIFLWLVLIILSLLCDLLLMCWIVWICSRVSWRLVWWLMIVLLRVWLMCCLVLVMIGKIWSSYWLEFFLVFFGWCGSCVLVLINRSSVRRWWLCFWGRYWMGLSFGRFCGRLVVWSLWEFRYWWWGWGYGLIFVRLVFWWFRLIKCFLLCCMIF